MENIQVKCPNCSAPITDKIDKEFIKCPYCGTQIQIDPKILEQKRIKEKQDFENRIALEEIKLGKEESIKEEKSLRIKIIVTIILGIITIACYYIGWISPDGSGLLLIGMLTMLAMAMLWVFSSETNRKKDKSTKRINPNYAKIDYSIINYKEKYYSTVQAQLQSLGFTNINCVPLCDLGFLTKSMSGQIQSITINGQEIYDEDYFPKDSIIVINYHSSK